MISLLLSLALAQEPPAEAPTAEAAEITAPVLLQGVEPDYPPEARDQGIQGDVLVLLTVGADGFVYEVELVQGPHSLLNMAAMDAAELLTFVPATQDGVAVPVQIHYRFKFDLGVADEQGTPVPGSLHGVVQDLQGFTVPNAQILIERTDDKPFEPLSLSSRQDGSFRATFLPSGEYLVTVTFPGFTEQGFLVDIEAGANLRRGFTISPEGEMTIVVTWEEKTWREVERAPLEPNVEAVTGSYTLTRRDIEATPGSMEDVSRAVHALPGIVSDGDMLATFNARGGETTDVVFLIDRVPLDNPFHLAGFNSLFNPDLISTVQFYAGTAPADVPSGTSAVLSVETWDGQPRQDASDIDGAVDISASSIRLLAMGPIGENANIAMAARRSYMETYFQVMKWANVIDTSFAAPEFSEYSARFAWRPIPRHRVMVTAMQSGDGLAIVDSGDDSIITVDGTFELSNALTLTSIDHRFQASDELTWQTTSAWTRDRSYMLRDLGGQAQQEVRAHRWFARSDLTWTPGEHEVLTGVDGSWHLISAEGEIEDTRLPPTWYTAPLAEYATDMVTLENALAYPDASAYVQETWKGPVHLRGGVRGTWNGATEELLVSPRAGFSIPLKTGTVPKASWGIYHRTPKDPRVLDEVIGNPDLHSERAVHYVLGIDQGFPLPWEEAGGLLRVEAYRIELTDLIVTPDTEQAIAAGTSYENAGTGRNQGVDVMLGARAGRAAGMATYSYLVATRENPLNEQFATAYAPGQDQRHTLGTSVEYQLTPRWRGTVRYSFHTGRPVSSIEPTADQLYVLTGVNDQRLGSFHNVDVRAEWRKAMDNYRLSFYAEVLNVANFQSDFVPTASFDEDDQPIDGMLNHLPIRPFLGIRADF